LELFIDCSNSGIEYPLEDFVETDMSVSAMEYEVFEDFADDSGIE